MAKKKQLKKYSIKLKTNKKCFNCGKKDYYARDYYTSNKTKPKKLLKKGKCAWWKKNLAKAIAARLTTNQESSDIKLYLASQTFMSYTDEGQLGVWYLDSCISRHICNS